MNIHFDNAWPIVVTAALSSLLTVGTVRLFQVAPGPLPGPAADTVAELAALRRSLAATDAADASLRASLRAVGDRLRSLEAAGVRVPLTQPAPARPPAEQPPVAAAEGRALSAGEFRALLPKVLRAARSGEASDQEQARFWQAARQGGQLAGVLRDLQDQVRQHPDDAALRMELADAYVARLLTVPNGPERGLWGMQAERQWQEAIDIDPEHWEAQYSLAFNYSMYPDFLNRTEDAIAAFGKALAIQQRRPQEPRFAKTYLGLARMHRKQGQLEKASELLREAAHRFPRNQQVAQALTELEQARPGAGK